LTGFVPSTDLKRMFRAANAVKLRAKSEFRLQGCLRQQASCQAYRATLRSTSSEVLRVASKLQRAQQVALRKQASFPLVYRKAAASVRRLARRSASSLQCEGHGG
jgi:hypothetical protein